MPYFNVYKNILFVEGDISSANKIKKIKTNIAGIGGNFKNLNHVKDNLVKQAIKYNCNCILDFKYGQKASLFSFDDLKYYGSGICSSLNQKDYKEIIEKNNI